MTVRPMVHTTDRAEIAWAREMSERTERGTAWATQEDPRTLLQLLGLGLKHGLRPKCPGKAERARTGSSSKPDNSISNARTGLTAV